MSKPKKTDDEIVEEVKRSVSDGVGKATSLGEVFCCLEEAIKVLMQHETTKVLSPENVAKMNLPHVDELVDSMTKDGDSHPEVTQDYRDGKIDFNEFITRRGGNVMTIPPLAEE